MPSGPRRTRYAVIVHPLASPRQPTGPSARGAGVVSRQAPVLGNLPHSARTPAAGWTGGRGELVGTTQPLLLPSDRPSCGPSHPPASGKSSKAQRGPLLVAHAAPSRSLSVEQRGGLIQKFSRSVTTAACRHAACRSSTDKCWEGVPAATAGLDAAEGRVCVRPHRNTAMSPPFHR